MSSRTVAQMRGAPCCILAIAASAGLAVGASSQPAFTGTPLRSDNKALFGVPMTEDAEGIQYYQALHEVGMREAHAEGGILKRVAAHVVDYAVQMIHTETGEEVEVTLSELRDAAATSKEVDVYLARRKLRFHEVYLETLLGPAFARFEAKRKRMQAVQVAARMGGRPVRDHQMLVIAMSNRHAQAILAFVRRRFPGVTSGRIGQDVPAAERNALLDAYREGRLDVMVQVDMIGEGTDIKPISVIVKADLVRAVSKTLQQVFRGMRHVPGWPEYANVCDLYAADDSDVVHTLRWIADEERAGLKKKKQAPAREAAAPAAPSERSAWEVKGVRHNAARTHRLDPVSSRDFHRDVPAAEEPPVQVVDVRRRERALRKACAALASELAFALRARGLPVEERDVHARAKAYLGAPQGALSLQELERKRRWLERCVREGRLL